MKKYIVPTLVLLVGLTNILLAGFYSNHPFLELVRNTVLVIAIFQILINIIAIGALIFLISNDKKLKVKPKFNYYYTAAMVIICLGSWDAFSFGLTIFNLLSGLFVTSWSYHLHEEEK